MIDTLRRLLPTIRASDFLAKNNLRPAPYGVITMHRPANVDRAACLGPLLEVLAEIARRLPLVFPIHPRTKKRIEDFGLSHHLTATQGMVVLEPLGYLDFQALTSQAKVIVTDSGGLQEESTALGIPCLTMRPNTERPITVDEGTSTLVGSDPEALRSCLQAVLEGVYKQGSCPALWDGCAAERIAAVLTRSVSSNVRSE